MKSLAWPAGAKANKKCNAKNTKLHAAMVRCRCRCCAWLRHHEKFDDAVTTESLPEFASKELSPNILEGEARLDEGDFEEAEILLRESLPINHEEARCLLGRMEYEKGNLRGALELFEGINLGALLMRLRSFASSDKGRGHHKKGKGAKSGTLNNFLHSTTILLEAIYLKAKTFQRLGAPADAARECKCVLDLMEDAFPGGMPHGWGETKVAKVVADALLLYPQLLVQEGLIDQALPAYRQALLSTWSRNEHALSALQKEFAILLLYGGVDTSSSSPSHWGSRREGGYVPVNSTEEAILLLLLLLRKNIATTKGIFDSSVVDHLCFALSVSGQPKVLAHQYEELLPGTFARADRWYNLALCYCGAGENDLALNLLRKSLSPVERPHDVASLLLAARICAGKPGLATEGVNYAQTALEHMHGDDLVFLKSTALHILGVAFSAQAKVASSDSERGRLQHCALHSLQEAAALESEDPTIIFDLGLEYALQRQLSRALDCAKHFLDVSSGAWVQGWRFFALLLTAQERHSEAQLVLEAAMEETSPWQQGPLLQTRAKVQMAVGQPLRAVHTYRQLLSLVQAGHQSFSFEAGNWQRNKVGGRVEEVEVWQDLASVYIELKQWRDVELALEKAQALNNYSATTWCGTGRLYEARGQTEEALASYKNALAIDTSHVDSKVRLGALLVQKGGMHSLPVARSYLAEALQAEPTHEEAWLQMGLLHKAEGHTQEAVECFQAAVQLEQSSPVEPFSSIIPSLSW